MASMDMSMSFGIQEALPHLTPPPTPGASMSYGSKGGKGSKSGGGSMSYGGKGEKKSRCRSKGSKSSEAPSLAPSKPPSGTKVFKTSPPTPAPTIYCGKGDKPSGGSGKGGKSGSSSMSYGGGKGGKSGGRSKGSKSSEAPSFMPSNIPVSGNTQKESSSSLRLRA